MRWILKRKKRVTAAAIVVGYSLLMLFGGCANRFILFPSRGALDPHGAKALMVPMPGGREVEVWVDRSPGANRVDPQAYVIEFTGNATRAEQVASYAAARWGGHPVEAWMVNYPGYGGSTGDAELSAIPPSALAVYDRVAAIAKGRPIFLAGNSLGTTAALYLASRRPCAGMILQNPPAIRKLILHRFGWWNLWLLAGPISLQVPNELDSPANAAAVKVPAIFILADDDGFVVPANQHRVVDAYAGEKHEIHIDGGHGGFVHGAADVRLQKEIDWLWRGAVKNRPAADGSGMTPGVH